MVCSHTLKRDSTVRLKIGYVMPIRLPPEWMKAIDNRLLEYLDEEGVGSPQKIHEDGRIAFTREYIGRRLRLLSNANLIEKVGRGVYRITPKGREYLSGEADLREEDKPE